MKERPLENVLYRPLENGAVADGWPLYRIPDQSFGKKPADLIGMASNGLAVLVEAKVVQKLPANTQFFPWQLFESNQINWLNAYQNAGAFALAALFEWPTDTMRVYRIQKEAPYPAVDLKLTKAGYVGWSLLLK